MRNPWKITTLILALLLAIQIVPRAVAQTSQPRLKAALTATQSAIRQLGKSGGSATSHKVQALKLLQDAEKEIKLAIQSGE